MNFCDIANFYFNQGLFIGSTTNLQSEKFIFLTKKKRKIVTNLFSVLQ